MSRSVLALLIVLILAACVAEVWLPAIISFVIAVTLAAVWCRAISAEDETAHS